MEQCPQADVNTPPPLSPTVTHHAARFWVFMKATFGLAHNMQNRWAMMTSKTAAHRLNPRIDPRYCLHDPNGITPQRAVVRTLRGLGAVFKNGFV